MEYNKINFNKSIIDELNKPIPKEFLQYKQVGWKKNNLAKDDPNNPNFLAYASGAKIIDILNKTFGNCGWSFYILEHWVEQGYDFFNTKGNEQKDYYNGKVGTWEKQGPTAHVKVRLTVHLKDENGVPYDISKESFGCHAIAARQSGQDQMFKAAQTDALKKAASLLGIALELYRKEEDKGFYEDLIYENPWTDKDKIKKANEIQELTALTQKYQLTQTNIANFALTASDNELTEVTPKNIDNVIALIKKSYEPANTNNGQSNIPSSVSANIPNNFNFPG